MHVQSIIYYHWNTGVVAPLSLLTAGEPFQAVREGHLVYGVAVCNTNLITLVTTTTSRSH